MRITLNDRYHQGVAVFERDVDGIHATLTFKTDKKIPLNLKYVLDNEEWKVISISPSNFVESVVTLGLEKTLNG